MVKLGKQVRSFGIDREQVAREGDFAIYECKRSRKLEGYEVIHIRIRKETEVGGRVYPLSEVFPSSEQWGSYGWTTSSLPKAQELLREKKEKYEIMLAKK